MNLVNPAKIWQNFWFTKQPVTPIALFRILFGLSVLQVALTQLLPNFQYFYGINAIIDTPSVSTLWWQRDPIFDAFLLVPESDNFRFCLFSGFILSAFLLTVGLFTRINATIVYLGLLSMHSHCPFNINGGDCFMRLAAFILCFSPCGEAISFDSLIAYHKNDWRRDCKESALAKPWAQRLLQIQLTIAYAHSTINKAQGVLWQKGTAFYITSRMTDLIRFPLPPAMDNIITSQVLTYFTLIIELLLCTLVWYRPCRYWILLGGIILHCGIDLTMNLPGFETLFMATYVTFIYPEDLSKAMSYIKSLANKIFGDHAVLEFDGALPDSARIANTIRRLDIFGCLESYDWSKKNRETIPMVTSSGTTSCQLPYGIYLKSTHGYLSTLNAYLWLASRLPLLWPAWPILRVFSCKNYQKFLKPLRPSIKEQP